MRRWFEEGEISGRPGRKSKVPLMIWAFFQSMPYRRLVRLTACKWPGLYWTCQVPYLFPHKPDPTRWIHLALCKKNVLKKDTQLRPQAWYVDGEGPPRVLELDRPANVRVRNFPFLENSERPRSLVKLKGKRAMRISHRRNLGQGKC